MAKRIITEADILAASANGVKSLAVTPGEDLVTAQARDTAQALGITLTGDGCDESSPDCALPRTAGPPSSSAPISGEDAGTAKSQLARQIAESLRGKIPPGVDSAQIERLVREAVAARTAGSARSGGARDCGVCFIDGAKLLARQVAAPAGPEKAVLAEAFGHAGESWLTAGYLAWERASFNRVVEAPEVCIILEGELHLTAGGETLIGKPGDMFYLPQGATLLYRAPSRVKLACVARPR